MPGSYESYKRERDEQVEDELGEQPSQRTRYEATEPQKDIERITEGDPGEEQQAAMPVVGALNFYGGEGGSMSFMQVLGLTREQRARMRSSNAAASHVVTIHTKYKNRSPLVSLASYQARFDVAQARSPKFKLDATSVDGIGNLVGGRRIPFAQPKIEMLDSDIATDMDSFLARQPAAVILLVTNVVEKLLETGLGLDALPSNVRDKVEIPKELQGSKHIVEAMTYTVVRSQMAGDISVDDMIIFAANPDETWQDATRLAPFNVNYRITPFWRAAQTVMITDNYKKMDVATTTHEHAVYAFNETVTTWALTNGCLEGQLARLSDTTRVKESLLAKYPENTRAWTEQEWSYAFENLGVKLNGFFKSSDDWFKVLMVGCDPDNSESMALFKIEPTSSAGIGWIHGTKRSSTILSDISFNARVLEMLQASDKDDNNTGEIAVRAMLETFRMVQIKPKFEITKISKLRTKVRNICVFGSYWQVSLGIFARIGKELIAKPFQNGGNSLSGFNPMYGGVHDTIQTMIGKVHRGVAMAFYSDNCYFLTHGPQGFRWISCDVEKMESSSTATEGAQSMKLLMLITGLEPDSVLGRYLQYMGGRFSHDCPGVLGKMVIPTPGMSSGSQITFLNNHIRMAMASHLVAETVRNDAKVLDIDDGEKINLAGQRVFFNLEKTTSDDYYRVSADWVDTYPMYKYLNKATLNDVLSGQCDKCGTLEDFGPIVKLDLLGFDATPVQISDYDDMPLDQNGEPILCACLDYERLYKAICFRKTRAIKSRTDGEINTEHNFVSTFISIVTMQTLYIVGGYAYAESDYHIKAIVAILQTNLHEVMLSTIKSGFELGLTNDEIAESRTAAIREQVVDYFTGGDSSEFVSPEIVEGLLDQISTMVDGALIGDYTTMNNLIDRAYVIKHFHSKTGLRIKMDKVKAKLRELTRRDGGLSLASRLREEASNPYAEQRNRGSADDKRQRKRGRETENSMDF